MQPPQAHLGPDQAGPSLLYASVCRSAKWDHSQASWDHQGKKGPLFITDKCGMCQAWCLGCREDRARAAWLWAVPPHLVPCPVLTLSRHLQRVGSNPGGAGPHSRPLCHGL